MDLIVCEEAKNAGEVMHIEILIKDKLFKIRTINLNNIDKALEKIDKNIEFITSITFKNYKFTNVHIQTLAGLLKKAPILESLTLLDADIDDTKLQLLMPSLQNHSSIKHINMLWNPFREIGFGYFADMLLVNTTLEELYIRYNNFNKLCLSKFILAIQSNTTLKKLDVSDYNCNIDHIDAELLFDALNTNSSLIEFNPEVGKLIFYYKGIEKIMKRNLTLLELEACPHPRAKLLREILQLRQQKGIPTDLQNDPWKDCVPTLNEMTAFFLKKNEFNNYQKLQMLESLDTTITNKYFPGISRIKELKKKSQGPIIYSTALPSIDKLNQMKRSQIYLAPYPDMPGTFHVVLVTHKVNETKNDISRYVLQIPFDGKEKLHFFENIEKGDWEQPWSLGLDGLEREVLSSNYESSGLNANPQYTLIT